MRHNSKNNVRNNFFKLMKKGVSGKTLKNICIYKSRYKTGI